jgi:hypothetical protein
MSRLESRPDLMTSSSNRPVRTTTVTSESEQEGKPALDLSFTKIAGGALAAVTTAVAASHLGVNGTLTGAAFGSVVSSVAAALYATSLKTAHTRIRATRTVVSSAGRGQEAGGVGDPTAMPPELTGRAVSLPGETMILPTHEGHAGPSAGSVPLFPEHRSYEYRAKRRVAWKPMAAFAGLVFVSAMAVIFVTEVLIGHPISNSSESGTTVSRVVQRDTSSTQTTDPTESATPSDSASESASPSDTSSDSPSSSDGQSPTDSAAPSDGASPTASDGQNGAGQTGSNQTAGQQASPTASAPADVVPSGVGGGAAAVPTATP